MAIDSKQFYMDITGEVYGELEPKNSYGVYPPGPSESFSESLIVQTSNDQMWWGWGWWKMVDQWLDVNFGGGVKPSDNRVEYFSQPIPPDNVPSLTNMSPFGFYFVNNWETLDVNTYGTTNVWIEGWRDDPTVGALYATKLQDLLDTGVLDGDNLPFTLSVIDCADTADTKRLWYQFIQYATATPPDSNHLPPTSSEQTALDKLQFLKDQGSFDAAVAGSRGRTGDGWGNQFLAYLYGIPPTPSGPVVNTPEYYTLDSATANTDQLQSWLLDFMNDYGYPANSNWDAAKATAAQRVYDTGVLASPNILYTMKVIGFDSGQSCYRTFDSVWQKIDGML